MHVCMHACMHVFMHACMQHACMHVCLSVSLFVCMHACMHACVCVYVCMHAMHVCCLAQVLTSAHTRVSFSYSCAHLHTRRRGACPLPCSSMLGQQRNESAARCSAWSRGGMPASRRSAAAASGPRRARSKAETWMTGRTDVVVAVIHVSAFDDVIIVETWMTGRTDDHCSKD